MLAFYQVPETRLELAQPCGYYTLNVARLPIPPFGQKIAGKSTVFWLSTIIYALFAQTLPLRAHRLDRPSNRYRVRAR